MSDTTKVIGDYNAAISVDGSTNYLLIQPGDSSTAYNKINRNVFLGVSGQPADISTSQTLSNKILPNSSNITVKDNAFTLQDDSDTTKQAQFQLSGITTSTTRTYTLPNASSTLADISTSQTFTNKTLTSPTINNGSITGTTITTDAIVGQSVSTSGTVYGLSISSGVVGSNGVVVASIATNAVTGSKLSTSAISLGYAQITSPFTTTTTNAYVDVTSLAVTVTVPAGSRNVEIIAYAPNINTSASAGTQLTMAILESSTVLGSTIMNEPVTNYKLTGIVIAYVSAPSAGSHTYKVSVGQNAAGTLTLAAGTANPAFSSPPPAYILVKVI